VRRALLLLAVLPVAFACASGDDGDGGDPEAFCASLADAGSGDLLQDFQPTDPAAADEVLDELRQLQDEAPPEVEAEVEVLADAVEQLAEAFDEGGGDLGAVLEQVDDLEDVQEVQTAAQRIADYAADQCGVDASGS
jgi:hypothetical protein